MYNCYIYYLYLSFNCTFIYHKSRHELFTKCYCYHSSYIFTHWKKSKAFYIWGLYIWRLQTEHHMTSWIKHMVLNRLLCLITHASSLTKFLSVSFRCLRMISRLFCSLYDILLLLASSQGFLLFYSLISGRTITNNLPRVPNLPLNLPQMPSFSAPSWMCDSTCVWGSWAPSLLTALDICLL